MATTDRPEPAVQPLDKAPDAFRTISEVAEDLDLPQHVLRFWETRFAQIKPLKRGGGRRYYRPDDVLLLRGIRRLLYGEGYTIKGVQKILRDQGLRYVASLGREASPDAGVPFEPKNAGEPPASEGPHLYAPRAERALRAPQRPAGDPQAQPAVKAGDDLDDVEADEDDLPEETVIDERWEEEDDETREPAFEGPEIRVDPMSRPVPTGPVADHARARVRVIEAKPRPDAVAESRRAAALDAVLDQSPPVSRPAPFVHPGPDDEPTDAGEIGTGEEELNLETAEPAVSTDGRTATARPEAAKGEPAGPAPSFPLAFGPQPLPEESARKLRLLLAELAECRRLLDKAR